MSAGRSEHLKADAALVALTSLWALTFSVVKDALAGVDPFTFLVLRFALGGAVLSLVARRQLAHRESVRGGLILSVFLFLGFALQTAGLVYTTPSRSAFITGMYVVLVPLVSMALFRRVPKVPSLLGVGLAAAGLYVLTQGGGEAASDEALLGDLLTVGCAVAYAFHVTLTEKYAPKASPTAMVAVQLWGVALLSALCLPFVERRLVFSGPVLTAVVVCGVLASALAISLQTWAQARTTAVRATLIFTLEPVLAALYSAASGREALGLREAMGGALVVSAVLVAELGNIVLARLEARRATAVGTSG